MHCIGAAVTHDSSATDSRRRFLRHALWAGAGWSVGCRPVSVGSGAQPIDDTGGPSGGAADSGDSADTADPGPSACDDPFDGGTFARLVGFVGEDDRPLEALYGEGLDARQVLDLSTLDADLLVVPNDRFFIRTAWPDTLDPDAAWAVSVSGQVATSRVWSPDELFAAATDQGVVHFECSGNTNYGGFGLQGAARWTGVPMGELLALAGADPDARVRVTGYDRHSSTSSRSVEGASWVFSQAQLEAAGAFLALDMNGAPLPLDHGAPVRLVVPGWYGCCCIKWVTDIELVDDDVAPTGHMVEFASRTHQDGEPRLARDYRPAQADLSAVPVRVERWTTAAGDAALWVVGLLWGGGAHGVAADPAVELQLGDGPWQPIEPCPARRDARTWGLWVCRLDLPESGTHTLRLRCADPDIPTVRLDAGWYERAIRV